MKTLKLFMAFSYCLNGCMTSTTPEQGLKPHLVIVNGDTMARGWLNGSRLDSTWEFALDKGRFKKSGHYLNGSPDSIWTYSTTEQKFFVQWTPIDIKEYSLQFSVPSVFRFDTSAVGKIRFVRIDSSCSDIIELELNRQVTPVDIDSLFKVETSIDTTRFQSVSKLCTVLRTSSGAHIIDIRHQLLEKATNNALSAFEANVRYKDIAMTLLCIICSGEEHARIIYGDMLMSVIYKNDYMYNPLLAPEITPCIATSTQSLE